MVTRAKELDARNGAAVVRGILDAIDTLAPLTAEMLLALATNWPQHDVRQAARQLTLRPNGDGAQGDIDMVDVPTRLAGTKEPTLFGLVEDLWSA